MPRLVSRRPQLFTTKLLLAAAVAVSVVAAAPAQAAPPPNDNFANSIALGSPPSQLTGTNIEATRQANEPAETENKTVWWKWTADQGGRFRLDVCDTLPAAATTLNVYTGASVGALTNVSAAGTAATGAPLDYTARCSNNSHSALVFDATVGQTYHVAVGSNDCCNETSSNLVLKLFKSAVNDNMAEATPLATPPTQATGSNVFASLETNEPQVNENATIWWRWTADLGGRFRADVCDTLPAAALTLNVYTGSSVASLTNVGVAGNGATGAPLAYTPGGCANSSHPALVFDATPGQTYWFAVGSNDCCNETSPNIVFKLLKSAVNDNFAEAALITGAPARVTGANLFASREQFEPAEHENASLWWRWVATQTGPFRVHTCKTQPDAATVIGVYTGAAVNALSATAAEVAGCGKGGGTVARFNATEGTTYYFAVGSNDCCNQVSPNVVLTLRDTDCDSANAALAKAKKKAKNANKALGKARRAARRNPSARNTRKLNNAKDRARTANNKVKKAKKAAGKRC